MQYANGGSGAFGRVTDTAGKPLGNAAVTASYRSGMRTITTIATTSASGLYAVLVPAPIRGGCAEPGAEPRSAAAYLAPVAAA